LRGRQVSTHVIVVWWVTCLIWSSVWLFIKLGVTDVPPFTFAAARLALAASLLLGYVLVRRTPWPADAHGWIVTLASGVILLGLNYALLYWGAQFIASGVTAVLQAATPAFSLVFATLAGTERLTAVKVSAILLGIAGVAVICLDHAAFDGWHAFAGAAAVACGAACVALAYVMVKAYGRHLNTATLMVGQKAAALLFLGTLALTLEDNSAAIHWTGAAIASVVYLALAGSILAGSLNYWLLRRMDATSLLSMGFVEPFIAVLLGAAFLGERLTLRSAAGGLAVLASVWVVLREARSLGARR
jgi:drug/metabolite transporter (DMT)-like permease